ncbi:unnamed protein product [Amoebophrya sp. A120]|nr:unnamed protein product [Amoebophrya sp. A120]|eukprot:GSA120T00005885001.1
MVSTTTLQLGSASTTRTADHVGSSTTAATGRANSGTTTSTALNFTTSRKMDSIRKISAMFDDLINMIPPRYYLNDEENWRQLPSVDDATPTTEVIHKLAQQRLSQRGKAKNKKQKGSNGSQNKPQSQSELRAKMQEKIAQMQAQRKEEQRQRDLKKKAVKKDNDKKADKIKKGTTSTDEQRGTTEPTTLHSSRTTHNNKDATSTQTASISNKDKTLTGAAVVDHGALAAKDAKRTGAAATATCSKDRDDVDLNEEDTAVGDLDFGNVKTEKAKLSTEYEENKKGSKWKKIDKAVRDEERKQKKLEKLDDATRKELEQREKMDVALKRAMGEKVKTVDNAAKLKKTKKHLVQEKRNKAFENKQKQVMKEQKGENKSGGKMNSGNKGTNQKGAGKKGKGGKNTVGPKRRGGFEGSVGKNTVLNKDRDV